MEISDRHLAWGRPPAGPGLGFARLRGPQPLCGPDPHVRGDQHDPDALPQSGERLHGRILRGPRRLHGHRRLRGLGPHRGGAAPGLGRGGFSRGPDLRRRRRGRGRADRRLPLLPHPGGLPGHRHPGLQHDRQERPREYLLAGGPPGLPGHAPAHHASSGWPPG